MNADIKKWLEKDGEQFLRKIGLKEEQTVLDFGCGEGHYTIPAAKIVGSKSKIYAFDKDKNALSELEKTARRFSLKNIELINGDTKIFLEDNSVDVVLCYDVIHYMKNRTPIYDEAHRVLKPEGFFSLYPKHHKDDYPLMELVSINLGSVIKEVEKSGFVLKDKLSMGCLHDDYYNECVILNFTPLENKGL